MNESGPNPPTEPPTKTDPNRLLPSPPETDPNRLLPSPPKPELENSAIDAGQESFNPEPESSLEEGEGGEGGGESDSPAEEKQDEKNALDESKQKIDASLQSISEKLSQVNEEEKIDVEGIINLVKATVRAFGDYVKLADDFDAMDQYLVISDTLKEAGVSLGDLSQRRIQAQAALLKRLFKAQFPETYESVAAFLGDEPTGPAEPSSEGESKPYQESAETKADPVEDQPESDASQTEVKKAEDWVESLEQECQELDDLIEEGRAKLSSEEDAESLITANEFQAFYQSLVKKEERVSALSNQVVRDIDAAELEPMQKLNLKEGAKVVGGEALKTARAFRQNELITNYFGLSEIVVYSQSIESFSGLESGTINPTDLQIEGGTLNAIELFTNMNQALDWALSFDLTEEDKKLIEERKADIEQKLSFLEKARQYNQEYVDFKDSQDNQEAEATTREVDAIHSDISARPTEQRAVESLSDFQNRESILASHEGRLKSELERFDEGSAAREEAKSLLDQVKNAVEKNKQAREMVAQAQLEVYLDKDEIKDLLRAIGQAASQDIEAVRGRSGEVGRLEERLANLKTALEEAKNADLLSSPAAAGYPNNELIGEQIEGFEKSAGDKTERVKGLEERAEDAMQHITDAIEAADEENRIRRMIESEYQKLRRNLESKSHQTQRPMADKILDLAKEIGPSELKKWTTALDLWEARHDAFRTDPEGNSEFAIQFCFSNEIEAWDAVSANVSFEQMRELISSDNDIGHITNILEIIMMGGPDYHQSILEYLEENNITPSERFQSNGDRWCQFNYLLDGDARAGHLRSGDVLKLGDLIKEIYPEANESSYDLSTDLITITGLRTKSWLRYAYGYASSPKPQNGVKGVARALAPLALMSYYVRKSPWRDFDLRDIFQYYHPDQSYTGPPRSVLTEEGDGAAYDPNAPEIVGKKMRNSYNVANTWIRFADRLENYILRDGYIRRYQFRGGRSLDLSSWSDDFQIFPTPWDMVRVVEAAGDDNEIDPKFFDFEIKEYVGNIKAWLELVKFVTDLTQIKIPDERVDTVIPYLLKNLADCTSSMKGLMGALKGTEYEERYKPLIIFLYLVALKRLYQSFYAAKKKEVRLQKRYRWYMEKFIEKIKASALTEGETQGFIQDFVERDLVSLNEVSRRLFSIDPKTVEGFEAVIRDKMAPAEERLLDSFLSHSPPKEEN